MSWSLFALNLDLDNRLFGIALGLTVGSLVTWVLTKYRLAKARKSVLRGDARELLVIEQHLVERGQGPLGEAVPARLRRRYLGQARVSDVIPNNHLAASLLGRASNVTERNTLISMEGAKGTYLLESICGFVCDRVANSPFDHELYVMAVCREPEKLAFHKPITIILITVRDLELFLDWEKVRGIEVEHSSDGVRLITLMDLAQRWKEEQRRIHQARLAGQSVRYMETMFLLDLALDTRSADIPTRSVPWKRFEIALKERNLV